MAVKKCNKCFIDKKLENFYFLKNKDRYATECKECLKKRAAEFYCGNKESVAVRKAVYFQENKVSIVSRHKKNRAENLSVYRKKEAEYCNKKYKESSLYRIQCTLRARIRVFVKRVRAKNIDIRDVSATNLLGISIKDFSVYLESKFYGNMSWDNRYLWHIDHIIPLNSAKNTADSQFATYVVSRKPL